MKQANSLNILILLLVLVIQLNAQDNNSVHSYNTNNKGVYLGGQLSTNGWGADVRYVFNRTFTLKAGVERLYLGTNTDFTESGVDYDVELDYRTGGIFLMTDINYTKNLYITLGAAQNSLNPQVKGVAANDLPFGDIMIPADMIGDFVFTLSPSMNISPYVGLGFRGFVGAKERLVYFVETGFYYLGSPNVEIEATGLLSPTADPTFGQNEVFEKQFSQYKFYPVVKFNLAIKIF